MTDEGMESVNFLLDQIDRKFQFYDENLAIVQHAVALNHAMLMGSCIFCDRELEVGFTELTPEVGFLASLSFQTGGFFYLGE